MPARPRPLRALTLLAPLSLLACKPAPSSSPLEALPPPPVAATTPAADPPAPLPPPPVTIYGHVRVPSPTTLFAQLRAVVPPAQATILDEPMLRTFAGSMLGERSALAEHIDLTRPLGCVVTSPKQHDRPFACVVAYTGGFASLVKDLGPNGYVSGGDDYAAYRFESQPIYFAAMGGFNHVAFAFAPDLIAATRDRLQHDIIDAPVADDDIVATAYPSAILEDARDWIEAMVDALPKAQAGSPSTDAAVAAQRKQWLSWRELERVDLWLDLADARVRLGYRGTALPGTSTEKAYAAARETGHDRQLMAQLPAESLAVASLRMDPAAMLDDPMLDAYAQAIRSIDGLDTEALAEQYRKSMALWSELSTGHAAVAMLHERGTKGGVAMVYQLKPGVDGLARLRELFASYQELSSKKAQPFRFEIRKGAFRAGKIRGDLWTIKPTVARPPAAETGIKEALGDPSQLDLAYAQRGDLFFMAIAPRKADRYLRRALEAADGKRALAGREDTKPLLDEHAGDTYVMAASVGAIVAWLVEIKAIAPQPFAFGEGLDDVVVTMRPAGERQRELTIDVAPAVTKALQKLGS